MKAKDIQIGHIYYVDFEPTRVGEFDKYHMALVLKKNVNNITFITVPITSNAKGLGKNKIKLDINQKLPKNLQDKESYAVYDQIRTVSASRFHNLMEDGEILEVIVDKDIIEDVLEKIITNLLYGMDKESINSIIDACKNIAKDDQEL